MHPTWWKTIDGDEYCLELYRRHYSQHEYKDGRRDDPNYGNRWLFCGPGEKYVLRTWEGDACFVWRKFIDDCIDERTGERQAGINCAVFRNESKHTSSDLIREADAIADFCWSGERHYTYVDASKIRSANPGYCFLRAGWKRLKQRTKSGKLILEKC